MHSNTPMALFFILGIDRLCNMLMLSLKRRRVLFADKAHFLKEASDDLKSFLRVVIKEGRGFIETEGRRMDMWSLNVQNLRSSF